MRAEIACRADTAVPAGEVFAPAPFTHIAAAICRRGQCRTQQTVGKKHAVCGRLSAQRVDCPQLTC